MFPTPKAGDGVMGRPRTSGRPIEKSTHLPTNATLPALLPTPNTMDNMYTRNGEAMERQLRRGEGPDASRRSTMGNLREDIMLTLDPTRFATDDPNERDKALMDAGLARTWSPFNNAEWGKYAHAVARWTMVFGSLPPAPVEPNTKGNPRLTAEFCEWLMGVPAGHITGEDINLTRTEAIKLAGNGVVPHAAVASFTRLIDRMS